MSTPCFGTNLCGEPLNRLQYPFLGEGPTQERHTPGADGLEQHTEPSWYSVGSYYKNACTAYTRLFTSFGCDGLDVRGPAQVRS